MTDVKIKYADGWEIKQELKNVVVAQTYVHAVIQTHREQGILHTIKGITIHEDQETIIQAYPIPGVQS